jgi:hypothetical protein
MHYVLKLTTTVTDVLAVCCKLRWLTPGALPLGSGVTQNEDVMRFDAVFTAVSVGSSVTLTEDVMRFHALLTAVIFGVKCYTN